MTRADCVILPDGNLDFDAAHLIPAKGRAHANQ